MKFFSPAMSLVFILGILLTACGSVQTRRAELNPNLNKSANSGKDSQSNIPASLRPDENGSASSNGASSASPESQINSSPPALIAGEPVRVGLVLGPGGMRAYAHIGVIQELVKAKIPIVAISGLELGALVGGIFANKGQTYDVEWQMMKLHEDDFFKKSLVMGSKPQDLSALHGFLQTALTSAKVEDAKVPFACPAFNIAKRQVYLMSRGPFVSMLPFCLPFTPFFHPFEQNVAGITSVIAAAKFLRSKGANYLIYVDLLGIKSIPFFAPQDEDANVSWNVVAESIDPQLPGFNRVINIPLGNFYLNDFDKRRDMIQRGQEAGRSAGRELQTEFGL